MKCDRETVGNNCCRKLTPWLFTLPANFVTCHKNDLKSGTSGTEDHREFEKEINSLKAVLCLVVRKYQHHQAN